MPKLFSRPERVASEHYLLKILCSIDSSSPGQFINVRIGNGSDPLLRRPFSIFNHDGDLLEIIIRVVGKGTAILSEAEPGEIDFIGPLGHGFTVQKNKRVLIIGGGVGNAPLYYLAKILGNFGNKITYLYGARTKNLVYCEEKFRAASHTFLLATDDGSAGETGTVPDIASKIILSDHPDIIYTCGPLAMMKKITLIAGNVPVEVSLENYFGCGFGICSGCTIETTHGPKRSCIDGPVFNGQGLSWETIPC